MKNILLKFILCSEKAKLLRSILNTNNGLDGYEMRSLMKQTPSAYFKSMIRKVQSVGVKFSTNDKKLTQGG